MSTMKKRKVKTLKTAKHDNITPKMAKAAVKAVKEKRDQQIKKVVVTIDATKLGVNDFGLCGYTMLMDDVYGVMDTAKMVIQAASYSDISSNKSINLLDRNQVVVGSIEFLR